jgi:hypothetical protein
VDNGAGNPELAIIQHNFREYKIEVYEGIDCDSITFEGQVESSKRLNLVYDDVTLHYHVIASLRRAMLNKSCVELAVRGAVATPHKCDQTCSDYMPIPPCIFAEVRITCADFNRRIRRQTCFDNNKKEAQKNRLLGKRNCASCCGPFVHEHKHERGKRYCRTCEVNREIGTSGICNP